MMKRKFLPYYLFLITCSLLSCSLFIACTFDYGDQTTQNDKQPDIIMGDVNYTRVRNGSPEVNFQATQAERFEKKRTMNLEDFSFKQFSNHGKDVNAKGEGGYAQVKLDSGDVNISKGVSIRVDSEDVTIKTDKLSWQDDKHDLSGDADSTVDIQKSDGTAFTGKGFSANTRSRSFEFSGGIEGNYVDDKDAKANKAGPRDKKTESKEAESAKPPSPGASP
jgi:LPS export ABC transporter protein LptC